MDIIAMGDFSITNLDGNTCMSFRMPSLHEIDYVKNLQLKVNPNMPIVGDEKVGRNQLCPCGSGKKYKHCNGA
ncbi:MAG: SEC-C domain-containing protein [Chitinophagales bacterium]|nr:SEC-C domain-containing protein [Chitinophagales bacterium]